MAMAIQVEARLWLGGVLSAHRDTSLMLALVAKVRACALCRPLLFCVDGCQAYIQAIRRVFREPIRTGRSARPRLRPWDGILIAQFVKHYARKRVVAVTRRIVQGSRKQIEALLQQTQGGGVINTAYIERLNATFRSRIAALVRRGRALARQMPTLHNAMYLVGAVYNFPFTDDYCPFFTACLYRPANEIAFVKSAPWNSSSYEIILKSDDQDRPILVLRIPSNQRTYPQGL